MVVCICMTLCVCSESNDNNTGATTNKKRRTEGNYIISYCCHFVCNCAENHVNSSVDITTSKPVAIATSNNSTLHTLCVYSDTSSDDDNE